jgi:hypothetical protein
MAPPSPFVQIQGGGAVTADNLNSFVQTVLNYAQLRTFTGLTSMAAFAQGATAPADGGQGFYYYNAASTASDNGGTVIVPTGAIQGAWLRLVGALSGNLVVDASSTTYTPSAGLLFAIVETIGGGGGGGGVSGSTGYSLAGGGGGAGAYAKKLLTAAQIGASQIVTVGIAGSGGSGAANGTNGTASSFGSLVVSGGGTGGVYASSSQVGIGGAGAGYTSSVGALILHGSDGQPGIFASIGTIAAPNAIGGASFFGGVTAPNVAQSGAVASGSVAEGYGGGGNGASACNVSSTATGSTGGPGIVIITEFILA